MNISPLSQRFYYLSLLIPIFLITGPALPDITLTIISVIFIFKLINRQYILFPNKIVKFFFIFYIYLVLNSLINDFSNNLFYSTPKSLVFLRFILFLSLFSQINDLLFKKLFLSIIALCVSFVIFDLFYQFLFGHDIFGFVSIYDNFIRLQGPFNDEYISGSYIVKFLIPILILILLNNKKLIILLSIVFLALLLSGERSALITFFSITTIFIFFNYSKKIGFLLAGLLLLSSFLLMSNSLLKDRFINQPFSNVFLDEKNIKMHNSFNQDYYNEIEDNKIKKFFYLIDSPWVAHYLTAYNIFDNNKLIGSGLRTFRIYCYEEYNLKPIQYDKRCSTHPHQVYLEFLSELGVIGLLFLITFIYLIIKNYNILFSFLFIFVFFPFYVPTGSFFNNWFLITFFVNLSVLINYDKFLK